jgi:hypothetical protein
MFLVLFPEHNSHLAIDVARRIVCSFSYFDKAKATWRMEGESLRVADGSNIASHVVRKAIGRRRAAIAAI